MEGGRKGGGGGGVYMYKYKIKGEGEGWRKKKNYCRNGKLVETEVHAGGPFLQHVTVVCICISRVDKP